MVKGGQETLHHSLAKLKFMASAPTQSTTWP